MPRLVSASSLRPFVAWSLFLAAAVLVGCSGSKSPTYKQGDAYILQMRTSDGATYEGVMSVDQAMDMNVRGQSLQMEQAQTMHYRYDVTDAGADSLTMTRTLTRAKGATDAPMGGGSQSYDTASDSTGQAAAQLRALLDLPVAMRMSRRGNVTHVIGMEALVDSLSAASGASAGSALRQMLDPESMKENVSSTFGFYPDRPVAVGDAWTAQHAMNMGVPFLIDATYTLRSVEGTTALLDAQYAVSSPDSSASMQMNGMSMTMQMDGTMEGTVRLDLESGMLRESAMDMDLSADAKITPPMGNQTIEMQMTMNGTTRSTLVPMETSTSADASK